MDKIAIEFKKQNPILYKEIMEIYAPVFDRSEAIRLWTENIPPPVCEICNKRILVTKKRKINRCFSHINTDLSNQYTYERLQKEYPGNFQPWEGYKTKGEDIIINCPKHKKYRQNLGSYIAGHGCQQCYFESKKRKIYYGW